MSFRRCVLHAVLALFGMMPGFARAQVSSPSPDAHHVQPPATHGNPSFDAGNVTAGIYRNASFGFTCKVTPGWVLRTEEMNARDEGQTSDHTNKDAGTDHGHVLLAAFSRPPQARAEDINSSILIAAESAASYPGLKDAAQYFGPLSEVTKAQGFAPVGEPYEFAVGTKTLQRADFQKDVGTRVMRQSTLVMLARGYAVSFTFIGGTEDEVEELIGGLSFTPTQKSKK